MPDVCRKFPFRHQLSLKPLVDFWREKAAPACPGMACALGLIESRLAEAPELLEPITDHGLLTKHPEVVRAMMGAIFASAFWETQAAAVMAPFTLEVLFANPPFEALNQYTENGVKFAPGKAIGQDVRPLRAYQLLLERLYGMHVGRHTSNLRKSLDQKTGLARYHRIQPDFQFLQVEPVGELKQLSAEDRQFIRENITDPAKLTSLLPPEDFIFSGLVVCTVSDVTDSEVLSDLQRELIDQGALFSTKGFQALQGHLANFFQMPDIILGVAAFQDDQVILINNTCQEMDFFQDTRRKHRDEFAGTVFEEAVENREIRYVSDLSQRQDLAPLEKLFVADGIKSLVIMPLVYEDQVIGEIDLASHRADAFNSLDGQQISLLAPLFAMAVKKSLGEIDTQVQGIIKEKCTAVHPSVEWRFRHAAANHLDRHRSGRNSEMEPIVFKDVYPLYASSDIRGSSELRNQAVVADLTAHLDLAAEVVRWAAEARDWPLLHELAFRLSEQRAQVESQKSAADENAVNLFIARNLEPVFPHLADLGPRVSHAIEKYRAEVAAETGSVYAGRRAFEKSVSTLNQRLGAYLDKEEAAAQAMFPHYFEKHQTDGLDYMIYLGASMSEQARFDEFFVRNLRLWQMQVSVGVAAITEELKAELPVKLDTAHLIFVQHAPLSIRFRYDEKRFDVDGAYDVRHEIIKSRLDKSVVAGRDQRLTQPGMLSVVYSTPAEAREIRRYFGYLKANGLLTGPVEALDLADMPGVRGLKALRSAMDLEVAATSPRLAGMTG